MTLWSSPQQAPKQLCFSVISGLKLILSTWLVFHSLNKTGKTEKKSPFSSNPDVIYNADHAKRLRAVTLVDMKVRWRSFKNGQVRNIGLPMKCHLCGLAQRSIFSPWWEHTFRLLLANDYFSPIPKCWHLSPLMTNTISYDQGCSIRKSHFFLSVDELLNYYLIFCLF